MSDCLSTSEARFVSPDKHQTPGGRNGGIHGVLYHNGKTLTIQSGPGNTTGRLGNHAPFDQDMVTP